jgi:hypothetical protein
LEIAIENTSAQMIVTKKYSIEYGYFIGFFGSILVENRATIHDKDQRQCRTAPSAKADTYTSLPCLQAQYSSFWMKSIARQLNSSITHLATR